MGRIIASPKSKTIDGDQDIALLRGKVFTWMKPEGVLGMLSISGKTPEMMEPMLVAGLGM